MTPDELTPHEFDIEYQRQREKAESGTPGFTVALNNVFRMMYYKRDQTCDAEYLRKEWDRFWHERGHEPYIWFKDRATGVSRMTTMKEVPTEELIRQLRETAAVWFKDRDLLMLEELIRRLDFAIAKIYDLQTSHRIPDFDDGRTR